jgi:glycine hydroxymethyltransferase
MTSRPLADSDPVVFRILEAERRRQREGVELIPSENYVSAAVLEAMGTIFTNKYSEGYPGRRYYGGNEYVDDVERLAQERAKALFGVPHANVQPYSGSPANLAVYVATCQAGDPIMGQSLPDGGHLTHGWKVSVTGQYYRSIPYHVRADGYIDFEEVRALAREHTPRLIWCGATAYVREFPFKQLAEIADEVGAFFAADIAHVAGLVVAGAHASPVPYAHVITTTTHKTLRGPRGAMILVTQKASRRILIWARRSTARSSLGCRAGRTITRPRRSRSRWARRCSRGSKSTAVRWWSTRRRSPPD